MVTGFLFVISLLTIVEPQSISRDLKQEGQTEDELCVGERTRTKHQDLFMLPDGLRPHRETNAYWKLGESLL